MRTDEIVRQVEGKLFGDSSVEVYRVAPLNTAKVGDLTFILDEKFACEAQYSQANLFITFEKIEGIKNQIVVKHPKKALAVVLNMFFPDNEESLTLSSNPIAVSSQIDKTVSLGFFCSVGNDTVISSNTIIMNNVTIGSSCKIGSNCKIFPNVTLYNNTVIGNNTVLHAGCVVGSDGYGYYPEGEKWIKVPHIGKVIIGDNVEIGANTCIDRGCIGDTTIKSGTKIDNLTHIAHNNTIGENCAITGHVAFAGSVTLGRHVIVAGQAGFKDWVNVGDNSIVMARAGVTKDFPNKSVISGFPAQSHRKELKERAKIKRLVS